MGRGPDTPETKKKKAMELAAKYLELDSVEELKSQLSIESTADKIWEAQSVITYFELKDKNSGYRRECEICGKTFVYMWYIEAVKCCSIQCMRKKLQKIGLDWDPNRAAGDRWGLTVPAIVPPDALFAIENLQHLQPDIQEDHSNSISLESD